jgi:UPF0755 protein
MRNPQQTRDFAPPAAHPPATREARAPRTRILPPPSWGRAGEGGRPSQRTAPALPTTPAVPPHPLRGRAGEGGPRRRAPLLALLATALLAACGGDPTGDPLRVTVPERAGLSIVADTLAAREIVGSEATFKLYARMKGAAGALKPGVYEFRRGEAYGDIVRKLVRGDVVKVRLTIPEGWTVAQIADRMATASGISRDSVMRVLAAPDAAKRFDVPGPTLEGYLYPATYVFPLGTDARRMTQAMVKRYKDVWTPEMRSRAAALGMDEREVVTLASIVEKEAKVWEERPRIAAVYHNRLKRGMRLQADPTVQYALGAHQSRLLYAQIDAVAGNPYNTYRHAGLPPGPIASPSAGAIQATLNPDPHDYLYFVARPNGTHVFTRTLDEHNRAKFAAQREAGIRR